MVLKVRLFAAVEIGEGNTDWLGRGLGHLARFALCLEGCSIGRPALISVELSRGTMTVSPRGWLCGSNSSPTLSICCWLSDIGRMTAAATASAAARQRVQAGWEGWPLNRFQYLSVSRLGVRASLLIADDNTRLCGHYRTKKGLSRGNTTFDRVY